MFFVSLPSLFAVVLFFAALTALQLAGGFFLFGIQVNALLIVLCAYAYLSRMAGDATTSFLFVLFVYGAGVFFLTRWIFPEIVILLLCVLFWYGIGRGVYTGTPLLDFLIGLLLVTLGFYGALAVLGGRGALFLPALQETAYTLVLGTALFFLSLRHALRSLYA